ncbi:hypothetical protein Ahy_A04g020584 isoform D [Arachis hypogaea]|uniref:Potassium transporter n=1 Tax=Arachis hypogaea TaxID=3818 RepID=A0A445DI18_ARAHY|nr:hypothetical protein Ahy_A04g020584 isoform D [Arachis hypogaea]
MFSAEADRICAEREMNKKMASRLGSDDDADNNKGSMWALEQKLDQPMDEEAARLKNMYREKHRTDEELTTYSRATILERSFAAKTKRWLETHAFNKNSILMLVLVGTCMVIGDGILTPAISVLSAAGGIKVNRPDVDSGVVVLVAVVILVGLFSLQHYGTDRVGWLFAPIVLLWFLLIGGIGMYNIWNYDSSVLKAFSPIYIYRYLRRGGREGWTSLGGILLSITGTEALFADLAHFPVSSVQIAFTLVVFPCLLLAYSGQAAYLLLNLDHTKDAFYRSIPATAAAIVASQATITATFSIIKQALAHGCFPRVKVVHTSKNFLGQIYIPDMNWILMILCIAVTAGFKNQNQIGNAYGTAVVLVMLVTTLLMILIMLLVWHCHWILVVIFTLTSLVVECTYFSAVLFKVDQGGWAPLVIAGVFFIIMYVWHYGTLKRYEFEMHSKVSMAWVLGLGPSLGLVRVPGVGLVYTELASGVPHIFSHFITNLPAIHSVVVFVCVKYLPVYTVPEEERFLVKRIGPKNFHMFRCVARYGYKDLHKKDDDFEKKLFHNLFVFVKLESMMEGFSDSDEYSLYGQQTVESRDAVLNNNNNDNTASSNVDLSISTVDSIVPVRSPSPVNITVQSSDRVSSHTEVDELEFLNNCRDAGVVHILGNTVVRARRDSRFYKKIAVDYIYAFLRKICREHSVIFNIPHESLLNVDSFMLTTNEAYGSNLKKKGSMWALDQNLDEPIDDDAVRIRNISKEKKFSALLILRLAYQSLGVVYGDLGTSPLYVFYNTFPHGAKDQEDVIGALSLIIYSLTLVPLIKYVFIVLRANDNGQGGTFALYSLLCRHANIKIIPNLHRTDEELTTYSRATIHEKSFAAKTKRWIEAHQYAKDTILILVLIGTCMMIGDGILTPTISVLSAVGGIKLTIPDVKNEVVVLVSVAIIVGLFSLQHYGTDRVGWLFAPIVLLWLLLIGAIGIYNILNYDRSVLRAFSPVYIYRYLKRGRREDWTSLGGIMLSITGTEALFADLAHFPVSSVQIAFTVLVFPCLLLAYSGQAAYLLNNLDHTQDAFYRSIPDKMYWPVFVVATGAAVVASQATISATSSIIKQARAHGCFPRVKIVHTSKKFLGQIYIPDINWILMVLCITVTAGFENQSQIGNAYGTAVLFVMLVTTFLMILIMILVWHCHWILAIIFAGVSLLVELSYCSAVLFKVDQGSWIPFLIAGAFFIVMYVWHYGKLKRYEFEMHSKVSMAWVLGLGPSLGLVRVPGVGLVYTQLSRGVPHIFSHFITNLPAIHSVVIFVCVKYLPVYTVPEEERFLVKRIGPKSLHMFRCVARYGYKDLHRRDDDFENKLFESLCLFVKLDYMMEGCSDSENYSSYEQTPAESNNNNENTHSSNMNLSVTSVDSLESDRSESHGNIASRPPEVDELEFLNKCRDAGVVHILGNTVVRTRDSRFYKKIAINFIYAFLRKICRENSVLFNIPHESLLTVGQICYI